MSVKKNTWSTPLKKQLLKNKNIDEETYAHEIKDKTTTAAYNDEIKDTTESIEKNNLSIIKQNSLIETNDAQSSTIPVNHHSAILQNKIFDKREFKTNKAPPKKIVAKQQHDEIDIGQIQDIVTVEYKKPQPKPKSNLKRFFDFLFQ